MGFTIPLFSGQESAIVHEPVHASLGILGEPRLVEGCSSLGSWGLKSQSQVSCVLSWSSYCISHKRFTWGMCVNIPAGFSWPSDSADHCGCSQVITNFLQPAARPRNACRAPSRAVRRESIHTDGAPHLNLCSLSSRMLCESESLGSPGKMQF